MTSVKGPATRLDYEKKDHARRPDNEEFYAPPSTVARKPRVAGEFVRRYGGPSMALLMFPNRAGRSFSREAPGRKSSVSEQTDPVIADELWVRLDPDRLCERPRGESRRPVIGRWGPSALGSAPFVFLLSAGCAASQVDIDDHSGPLPMQSIILLPFINASGAPLAAERTEALVTTLLRRKGVRELRMHSTDNPRLPPELDDRRRYQSALVAAREFGPETYGITGTVVEWGYRPGLDDQPAVSVSLRIVDVKDGRVLWSASAARGERGTLGTVAQSLLRELTEAMPLSH